MKTKAIIATLYSILPWITSFASLSTSPSSLEHFNLYTPKSAWFVFAIVHEMVFSFLSKMTLSFELKGAPSLLQEISGCGNPVASHSSSTCSLISVLIWWGPRAEYYWRAGKVKNLKWNKSQMESIFSFRLNVSLRNLTKFIQSTNRNIKFIWLFILNI